MERKGGCCLAPRSYGGAGGQAGVSWQMGRIMLKFRPIAPKPAAMASAPVVAAGEGKGKRKAVGGGGGGRRGRKPKKAAAAAVAPVAAAPVTAAEMVGDKESEKEKSLSWRSSSSSGMTSVDSSPPAPLPPQHPATLPLMPVSPVEEELTAAVSAATATEEPAPVAPPASEHAVGAQLVAPRPLSPAAAAACWVTVEHVTATWLDGSEAPSASAAAAAACVAGDDDAPAFVSDQCGRVTWANAAFARSVSGAVGDSDAAPAVALAGALPAWGTCAGFTCRVRVLRARGCGGSSVVAPCDAWRLDAGGCYLWRLDLQAALTLGLGLSGLP